MENGLKGKIIEQYIGWFMNLEFRLTFTSPVLDNQIVKDNIDVRLNSELSLATDNVGGEMLDGNGKMLMGGREVKKRMTKNDLLE